MTALMLTEAAAIGMTLFWIAFAVAAIVLLALGTRPRAKQPEPVTEPTPVTVVNIHSDAPLDADDLLALRHLLTATYNNRGEDLYQAIFDQVAADVAAEVDFDAAAARIIEGGAA